MSAAATDIELLGAWFCPNVARVAMALAEKLPSSQYTITESMKINLTNKTIEKSQQLLELNPKGLVPVLIDRRGGDKEEVSVVSESLICIEYIDEAIIGNDTSPKLLLPGSPQQRAHARMICNMLTSQICNNYYKLLLYQDTKLQEVVTCNILEGVRNFSQQCKGPFFYGNDISIVDIAIAPWMVGTRLDVLKHYRNFEIPNTDEYEMYRKWRKDIANHPSFIMATKDSNDLQRMIEGYLPFAEGTGYTTSSSKASSSEAVTVDNVQQKKQHVRRSSSSFGKEKGFLG